MEKKKIIFIIPKYKIGGAENVMIALAKELSKYDTEIFFVTLSESKKIKINKKINFIQLNSKRAIFSIFKLKKLIDQIKPSVCLSTISHTNIILYFAAKLANHNCKIISRESNNIFESLQNMNIFLRPLYLYILKFVYQDLTLLSPSKKLSKQLKKKLNIKKKVYYVANPIIRKKYKYKKIKKIFDFINIASITNQKDHITLLKALKLAVIKNNKLQLLIIGEGRLKKQIRIYIKINMLNKNVILLNNKTNIDYYLKRSKLFILSSRYEGYPNVLLDAAANNLPIISSNCNFGPSEILSKGKYGKLFNVGDYLSLSKLMLINYKNIKKIPNNKLQNNNLKIIAKQYYDLFIKE